MVSPAPSVDLGAWIARNREQLERGEAGPVMAGGELKVLVVAGRGPRRDYHVNAVDELFYQLQGDITVTLREGGGARDVSVRTGELWVAAAGVPHSPQRPVGTLGLVVERIREAGTTEAFRWFCERCGAMLHELVLPELDIRAVRAAIVAFDASESARTCISCGAIMPAVGPPRPAP